MKRVKNIMKKIDYYVKYWINISQQTRFHIILMCIFSCIFGICITASAFQTENLNYSKCESAPKLIFYDSDISEITNLIKKSISSAKKEIMLSYPSEDDTSYFQIFNESLLEASKRGVFISIITTIELNKVLYFPFEYELISLTSLSHRTYDCFAIADNDIFYTPLLYRNNKFGYMLYNQNCPALAKDTLHFYQWADLYSHSTLPDVISTNLYALSSSVRPTITPEGIISQFHSPPTLLAPLRNDLGRVLTDALYNPSNIYLYTSIYPTPPNIKWMNTEFSLYGNLWAHALRNETNIKILSHEFHHDQVGLECFQKVDVRIIQNFEKQFPNFMIIDDNLYLFHYYISEPNFFEFLSLSIQTNITSIKNRFMEKFNEDWENSASKTY